MSQYFFKLRASLPPTLGKKGCEHVSNKITSKYGSDLAIHIGIPVYAGNKEERKSQELSKQKGNII